MSNFCEKYIQTLHVYSEQWCFANFLGLSRWLSRCQLSSVFCVSLLLTSVTVMYDKNLYIPGPSTVRNYLFQVNYKELLLTLQWNLVFIFAPYNLACIKSMLVMFNTLLAHRIGLKYIKFSFALEPD